MDNTNAFMFMFVQNLKLTGDLYHAIKMWTDNSDFYLKKFFLPVHSSNFHLYIISNSTTCCLPDYSKSCFYISL